MNAVRGRLDLVDGFWWPEYTEREVSPEERLQNGRDYNTELAIILRESTK